MTRMYHGGELIKDEIKIPFFCYQEISDSIYYATGYSEVNEKHISEFQLNNKAKVLDLTEDNREENEKIIDNIMSKIGLIFEDEYLYLKNSNEEVGQEVFGYDINLALFPKFRDELLKLGYNVLKTYTVIEITEPVGYAILDSSVIDLKREYSLLIKEEGFNVVLNVIKENISSEEKSILGKSYTGKTGNGDIILKELKSRKKKM